MVKHTKAYDFMEKLKILVCTHKSSPFLRYGTPYLPIHGGKANAKDLEIRDGDGNLIQADDEGDNISELNPSYCEYTALYWGWKNLKDVEYVGLCHYRRYFKREITEDNIERLIKGYDIIVPMSPKMLRHDGVYNELINVIGREDFWIYIDTVLTLYPDAYKACVDYYFNNNVRPVCSMLVASKDIYDDWCSFIFPLLEAIGKRIRVSGYWRQRRSLAYIGEFSLGLYIMYRGLRAKNIEKFNVGSASRKTIASVLQQMRKNIIILLDSIRVSPVKKLCVPDDVLVGFKNDGIELNAIK